MGKAVAGAAAGSASAARRIQGVMIGMAVTLLAAISISAWAQPASAPAGERGAAAAPSQHRGEHHHRGDHHGMGRMHHGMDGGMHGGMMFRGSPERMGRMIDHMLDGLNASDAQRSQIKQIAVSAAADMKGQAQSRRALRQRAMQAFTAANVDPAAVEQIRQQMLQQHDQSSRRMSQAMLDVARVLTPEQRTRLGERLRDRQARMEDRMKRMESMPRR